MVSEELRISLHQRLDELLDRRSALEAGQPANTLGQLMAHFATMAERGARARPLLFASAEFARDLVGDDLRDVALDDAADEKLPREILRSWLSLVLPLLKQSPYFSVLRNYLTIYDVLDGLSALDAGEIQPLFKANTGKNRRANRWTMARAKLDALVWKKRLVAMGIHDKEASYRVTVAFEEQWETIRKWKSQCEDILGDAHVRWELHFAGNATDPFVHPAPSRSGMFAASPSFNPESALTDAGAKYKRERTRAVELSKRKGRGINTAPLHPDQKTAFNSESIAGQ